MVNGSRPFADSSFAIITTKDIDDEHMRADMASTDMVSAVEVRAWKKSPCMSGQEATECLVSVTR